MYQLGQFMFDPRITAWLTVNALDYWEEQKLKALLPDFPRIFSQAQGDWAKLKLVVKSGAIDPVAASTSLDWFREFPKLWETIRPNYEADPVNTDFMNEVDLFVSRLGADQYFKTGQLGLAPLIIAGVLVVGGAAAALWAIGYIKRQNNISEMIDLAAAGTISESVLKEALEADSGAGPFETIGSLLKWAAIAAVGVTVLPTLWRVLGAKR